MRVTISGASGLVGSRLVERLQERGDEVTRLSRNPNGRGSVHWDPSQPAPAEALAGRDAVIHLAGEPVAQRWNEQARRRIRASRELGTRNVVAGIAAAEPRPSALISASAVGYYGPRGDEPIDEDAPPGSDFLAGVCVAWERAAQSAAAHGLRVVSVRTGVVLDRHGGALAQMLPPFKLGVGGPVAGGRQYVPWIHLDDLVGIYLAALDDAAYAGPVNGSAPTPVPNAELSRALGRALHRPAVIPTPTLALRALFGQMSVIVTTGQRALPRRALEHGYAFRYGDLDAALQAALA